MYFLDLALKQVLCKEEGEGCFRRNQRRLRTHSQKSCGRLQGFGAIWIDE
jgi:hypothetical protein